MSNSPVSKPHLSLTAQEAYEAVRESLVDGRDGYEECGICGMELSRGHRMDCAFPNALSSLDNLFEQFGTLHAAALALLESADDQTHPDDGFPIEEWLNLMDAVRGSNPASEPVDV